MSARLIVMPAWLFLLELAVFFGLGAVAWAARSAWQWQRAARIARARRRHPASAARGELHRPGPVLAVARPRRVSDPVDVANAFAAETPPCSTWCGCPRPRARRGVLRGWRR